MVVPAQPVGGARHDRQQRPLGHPPGDRRGQVLGGLRCALAAAPLEAGDPALGDDQVGVVLIPGIQGGGRVQVGAAQPLSEGGRVSRQAGFLAEGGQQRLALGPGEQVGAPVGVLAGPGHGDVAGAQLSGQVGEYHRLEVPPGHHARMAAVGDGRPPVCRGERDARPVLAAIGYGGQRDEVAALGPVLPGVLQAGQHRAVARSGQQFEPAGQVEHHCPVLAEEPGHQHLVVVAVEGRYLLDVGQLRGEPARVLDRGHRPGLSLAGYTAAGLFAAGVQVLQHGAVGADQPLRDHALAQPDLLQLRPDPLHVGRHPLAQHLG